MRVAAVISDLMLYSRIESAATAAGASLVRVDSPADLPDDLDLVLVDWSARQPDWADVLATFPARSSCSVGTPTWRPTPPPEALPRPDVGALEAAGVSSGAVYGGAWSER